MPPNGSRNLLGSISEVTAILRDALSDRTTDGDPNDDALARVAAAVEQAIALLAPEGPLAERLAGKLESAKRLSAQKGLEVLRQAVKRSSSDLEFAPIQEAPLPKGFPTYTPVGTIEVKEYPKHRMAVDRGFFPLFQHIQQNNVAMTTPVQMDYEVSESGLVRNTAMAFFYGDPETGEAGDQGGVKVTDGEPMQVVSMGVRGTTTDRDVRDAHERLTCWLANHPEFEAAGELRVKGYNSPFVENLSQFYEVQMPIRKIEN